MTESSFNHSSATKRQKKRQRKKEFLGEDEPAEDREGSVKIVITCRHNSNDDRQDDSNAFLFMAKGRRVWVGQ